jgi:homocysteine S-methyltransferase
MNYGTIEKRLAAGGVVLLDGGTGTELQRRGASMDPEAWCGPASLGNAALLEEIHRDYIAAGADIITANTYASSRLMLGPAGFADRFEEINRTAIQAALRARESSGRSDVLVAGSLSHMCPFVAGTAKTDPARRPPDADIAAAFDELSEFLQAEGCDLILLEMMYYPERTRLAFAAAKATGLPVWAGFSARRSEDGRILSFAQDRDIPFEETLEVLEDFDLPVAGIMHTRADITGEALAILRDRFDGPLMAYPDSGYFKMPNWQFEEVIPPEDLLRFARQWQEQGVQVFGGCCGLSPEHIAALRPLHFLTGTCTQEKKHSANE